MFHIPCLSLLSEGEGGPECPQAVVLGLRGATPGPRSPATAASRDAVGMSGAVMLGEVGDLVQGVGGAKAGGDGEKVGPWWGLWRDWKEWRWW